MKLSWIRSSVLFTATLAGAACAGVSTGAPAAGPIPRQGPGQGQALFPTNLPARFEVVGRGPVAASHTSDVWVFRGANGRDFAYTGTWGACAGCYGDRMYAWDVTDPARPVLTDSVVVDARVVNDVKVNREGTLAVITREGASSRRNGIVILDLADPAHPKVASEYFETLTGGVHNTFIEGNLVYAVHNGTADVHIIDVSNPRAAREVGRWGLPQHPGKYLHDVWVKDGLAYLSYWDAGLVILDVGRGIKGGTPQKPQLVSQHQYRTRLWGQEFGNTHVAFPYTNRAGKSYVFVGDEIFPRDFDVKQGDVQPGGYVHVIDVSNLERPVEVARYEVPGAGVHNVWVENDTLYTAYYNAGLRAVDVSGDLRGDLRAQGREIAVLPTTDVRAFVPNRPFTWGPQPYRGLLFASDHNSGLWVARLVPARPASGEE
ncbi:MAG: hypothetical protein M3P24_01940 [Gemmatimonadota bacterium]|nr:hypothetical protein [Gemmatimonadota bacterium]